MEPTGTQNIKPIHRTIHCLVSRAHKLEQKRWSFCLGLLIAAAFCRAQRGLIREQLVQRATWCPPAHTYTATLCFPALRVFLSKSEKKKKVHIFQPRASFFHPPAFFLHVANSKPHPRAGSVTRERGAIPPLARANIGITGMSQCEQPSLSPGTGLNGRPRPLQASFFLSCFLADCCLCTPAGGGGRVSGTRAGSWRSAAVDYLSLWWQSQGTLQRHYEGTAVFLLCTALPPLKITWNPHPLNCLANIYKCIFHFQWIRMHQSKSDRNFNRLCYISSRTRPLD